MNCLNNKCNSNNKKGNCKRTGEFVCGLRIIKTPSYAEEQLESAQENENICYNKECQHLKDNRCSIFTNNSTCSTVLKEPIDYEKEYSKLKEELEEVKRRNENQRASLAEEIGQRREFKELNEKLNAEINQVVKENVELKETHTNMEKSLRNCEMKAKNEQIENLEKDVVEYKEANAALIAYGDECSRRILDLENAKALLKSALESSNEMRKREADALEGVSIAEEKQKRRELIKLLAELL